MVQRENGMMIKNKSASPSYTESEVIMSMYCQGISRVLLEWNGLQMAIQNQWGGYDSHQKSQQLVFDIFSWFCKSRGTYFCYYPDVNECYVCFKFIKHIRQSF